MDDEELPQAGETILLRPIYAFGFHGIPGHKAQLVCIEENTVAYAVGCNLVVHSLSTMIMQFLQSSSSIQKIIAVAASPNRQIIAICETTKSGHGQITVVDTKKLRKMQKFTSGSVTEFEVCALTHHGERLIAATKDQRASLICWDIQHEKVIGNIAVYKEITHVTANPHDNDLFASSGPTHFRLWSLKGGYLQNIVIQGLEHFEDEKFTITDHVWLPDGAIAVAVAEEMIFIVRDGALQTKLVDAGHTTCFACSRKGFFAGDNDGTLKEFIITAKAGEPPIYTKHTRIRLNGPISWIAVPPDRAETAYIVQLSILEL